MKLSTSGMGQQAHEVGSRVVYFPQGHSEQVAATTYKEVDVHIPNYPSLSPQLICQLHNATMHVGFICQLMKQLLNDRKFPKIHLDLQRLLQTHETNDILATADDICTNLDVDVKSEVRHIILSVSLLVNINILEGEIPAMASTMEQQHKKTRDQ
ncbi:auxin response factor, partial [Striga asiatica]